VPLLISETALRNPKYWVGITRCGRCISSFRAIVDVVDEAHEDGKMDSSMLI
jgi:hypothetical protein